MIGINNIHKVFNKGKANQVNAVNGIDLKINNSEFVVIVGSNGSGKTTLLNLVSGSVMPTSGTISIDDHDVTNMPDYKRSEWIARVFQNPLSGTASDLSILDNFRLAAIRPGAVDRTRQRKPEIPRTGDFGIPLRDEIDLTSPV